MEGNKTVCHLGAITLLVRGEENLPFGELSQGDCTMLPPLVLRNRKGWIRGILCRTPCAIACF
jgi:hypothetical protein